MFSVSRDSRLTCPLDTIVIYRVAFCIYLQVVQAPKTEVELSNAAHGLRIMSFTEEGKAAIEKLDGWHSSWSYFAGFFVGFSSKNVLEFPLTF